MIQLCKQMVPEHRWYPQGDILWYSTNITHEYLHKNSDTFHCSNRDYHEHIIYIFASLRQNTKGDVHNLPTSEYISNNSAKERDTFC